MTSITTAPSVATHNRALVFVVRSQITQARQPVAPLRAKDPEKGEYGSGVAR